MTIKVQDANTLAGESGNVAGGFLMSSGDVGTFTWTEDYDIRPAVGTTDEESTARSTSNNISQSDTDEDGEWVVTWTSPSVDDGAVVFYVVGNSINDNGQADEEIIGMYYHSQSIHQVQSLMPMGMTCQPVL